MYWLKGVSMPGQRHHRHPGIETPDNGQRSVLARTPSGRSVICVTFLNMTIQNDPEWQNSRDMGVKTWTEITRRRLNAGPMSADVDQHSAGVLYTTHACPQQLDGLRLLAML